MSSLFGLGGGAAAAGTVNPAKLAAAEAELDMVTDMFNRYVLIVFESNHEERSNASRLVEGCYKKCINTSYSEGDVNKGEALCLDRCVAKYFEVNTKVGEVSSFDSSSELNRSNIYEAHAKAWK